MLSESKDSFTSFSVFIPSVLFLASWHWLLPPVCIEQKWWGWTWLSCSQYFLILFIFSCRFRLHLRLLCFSSVQLLSCVWFFVTPWTAARQTSLSITHSWSLLKLMSIANGMDEPVECSLCVCVCGCVQSLSHVQLFVTPWTVAHQAFLLSKNIGVRCHALL